MPRNFATQFLAAAKQAAQGSINPPSLIDIVQISADASFRRFHASVETCCDLQFNSRRLRTGTGESPPRQSTATAGAAAAGHWRSVDYHVCESLEKAVIYVNGLNRKMVWEVAGRFPRTEEGGKRARALCRELIKKNTFTVYTPAVR